MPKLIRRGGVSEDSWQLLQASDTPETLEIPAGDVIVPLNVWLARKDELLKRDGKTAVWLSSTDEPEAIASDLPHLELVAIDFPVFADGRGFSYARLIRERYGFKGEVRAIGDVARDQLFYMMRCGFDAFLLRDDQDEGVALKAFEDFADAYQAACDQPAPLFRRRAAGP